jgi:hypothetical protein
VTGTDRVEDWAQARELNRAHWDDLATIHGQDDYYDARALVDGHDSLTEEEEAAVREAVGSSCWTVIRWPR